MNETYKEPLPPERALIIAAHPDDIEFVMAGTAAKWAQAGASVQYVIATSGDAGSHQPGITREELAHIRETEQRAAARTAGVNDVVFLHHPDGEVEPTMALRRDLVREIRRFKPDTVVCSDPTRLFVEDRYINHPDHRAVAQAALDAVAPASAMPLVFSDLREEGLEPHRVTQVFVSSTMEPNTWIDITDTIDLKIEALRQHTSQFPDDWDPDEMVREWATEHGAKVGVPYAEAYRRFILFRQDEDEDNGD
ncbi:MAG: PIG-L family deacetylase [Chloroflexi bacterium]|nr:PIG-L family deacetylase [Chloroflexota bacterium]